VDKRAHMSSAIVKNTATTGSGANSNWKSFSDYLSRGYRPDIDGLRAIAVLSVIAYHFHIGPVPGGFTGVDIFFVISGFLITKAIADKLDLDAFSFLDFYQRRIRRIFPALVTLLLFTFAAGLSVLRQDELFRVSPGSPSGQIYRGIAAGAAFVTNFTLLRNADYFTQTATSQPLLHLWSLAIEEQFYIIWPLLLYGVRAIKARHLPVALAIAAISFGINILTVHADPATAFYSPLSRAWELMIGAALSCLSSDRVSRLAVPANARSAIGLILIVVGLFAINNRMAFPGWVALAPAIGTLLAISAGPDAFANRRLLGAKPLVVIGLISYPLYLWHWPALLFFEKYSTLFVSNPVERQIFKAAALLCTAAASWLTFRYVEIPFRFGRWRDSFHTGALVLIMVAIGLSAAFAPSAVLSFSSLSPYQREMIPLLTRVMELKDLGKMYGDRPCFKYRESDTFAMFLRNGCVEPKQPGNKTVFLIGDSHSASLSLGLRPLVERFGINFLQVSTGFCEPTSNDGSDLTCTDINNLVASKVSEVKPDVVIMDAFWIAASQPPYFLGGGDYFAHLRDKLNDLERRGAKRIIVVGEIPTWYPSLPEDLAQTFVRNNQAIPRRTFLGVDPQSLRMDTQMKALNYPSGAIYLSLNDTLCDDAGCLTAVGPDLEKNITVWDYGHLTQAASEFVARTLIAPAMSDILPQK
jgi:peptidoglycan/LPS O-acetylase OafA/YrhL